MKFHWSLVAVCLGVGVLAGCPEEKRTIITGDATQDGFSDAEGEVDGQQGDVEEDAEPDVPDVQADTPEDGDDAGPETTATRRRTRKTPATCRATSPGSPARTPRIAAS